jgi:hypothetical protein
MWDGDTNGIIYEIVDKESLNAIKNCDDEDPNDIRLDYERVKDFGGFSTGFHHALDFLGIPPQAVFGVEYIEYDYDGVDRPILSYIENAKLPDIIKAFTAVRFNHRKPSRRSWGETILGGGGL